MVLLNCILQAMSNRHRSPPGGSTLPSPVLFDGGLPMSPVPEEQDGWHSPAPGPNAQSLLGLMAPIGRLQVAESSYSQYSSGPSSSIVPLDTNQSRVKREIQWMESRNRALAEHARFTLIDQDICECKYPVVDAAKVDAQSLEDPITFSDGGRLGIRLVDALCKKPKCRMDDADDRLESLFRGKATQTLCTDVRHSSLFLLPSTYLTE